MRGDIKINNNLATNNPQHVFRLVIQSQIDHAIKYTHRKA